MWDQLLSFEWDVHNVGHVIIPASPGKNEKRWKLLGRTAAGRYLVVVFTVRRERFRTVTAYTMNLTERKVYGSEIEG